MRSLGWRSRQQKRALCPLVLLSVRGRHRGDKEGGKYVTLVGCPLRPGPEGWGSLGGPGCRTSRREGRGPSQPYRREGVWPGERP